MAIQLKNTRDVAANGIKALIYGEAGAGKTTLVATLPAPIVLSAEGGLLSINHVDVPYIEIKTAADVDEAYAWLTQSPEAAQFQSIAIDSISEIAEVVLADEVARNGNPQGRAYGVMGDAVGKMVRLFRDLPGKHVFMTAKLDKVKDHEGRMLYGPSMPGQKVGAALPYQFDIVAALRIMPHEGVNHRTLMMESDGLWTAKHRFRDKLATWEAPDLGAIIKKANG
jgi:phage nucleotide-binding protein